METSLASCNNTNVSSLTNNSKDMATTEIPHNKIKVPAFKFNGVKEQPVTNERSTPACTKDVEQGQLMSRATRTRKITPANVPNASTLEKLSNLKQSSNKWEITEEEEEEEEEMEE